VLVDTIPERDVVTWPAICTNNQLIQRQRADLIKKIGGGKRAPRKVRNTQIINVQVLHHRTEDSIVNEIPQLHMLVCAGTT